MAVVYPANAQVRAKVLRAFADEGVAESDLWGSVGYGYDDPARARYESLLARVLDAERALRAALARQRHARDRHRARRLRRSGRTHRRRDGTAVRHAAQRARRRSAVAARARRRLRGGRACARRRPRPRGDRARVRPGLCGGLRAALARLRAPPLARRARVRRDRRRRPRRGPRRARHRRQLLRRAGRAGRTDGARCRTRSPVR